MRKIATGLLLLILAGCGGGTRKNAETPPSPFPRINVPVTITDPQAQAKYFIEHYWDRFDFADTLFLARQRDTLEQALVDYLVVLPHLDTATARQSIARLMTRAQADTAMFRFFREETEHYLWDPNSPFRNEELYIPVLEFLAASGDAAVAERAKYRLTLALKNRPGESANDFTYVLASGRTEKMSQIRSEYLLLFFNNPECPACSQIMAQMDRSPLMNRLLEEKRLAVLAVYTDEDFEKWRNYLPQMPAGWIVAYDPDRAISNGNLYDLKAIPTLYLLDNNKTVLLKDADIQVVEAYLQQMLLGAN